MRPAARSRRASFFPLPARFTASSVASISPHKQCPLESILNE
jgi:hypothetical protein